MTNDIIKHHNYLIEIMLRNAARNATPPIRGDVTAGKIKWRGMRHVINGNQHWVEQRGKRITEVLDLSL